MNPEHIHLLLNHIPIHGLAVATLILWVGVFLKNRTTIAVACAMVMLTSLSIPLVMGTGESAYHRYKQEPEIRQNLTDKGLQYAHLHYENAEKGSKLTYLLIALSAGALLSLKFKPAWSGKMAVVVCVLSLVCLFANAWIATSGGKIRRPDFQIGTIDTSHHEKH